LGLGHDIDRDGPGKHADLHCADIKIGKDGIDLRRDEVGRHIVDAVHALGILCGNRGDDSGAIDA